MIIDYGGMACIDSGKILDIHNIMNEWLWGILDDVVVMCSGGDPGLKNPS